MKVYMVRKRPLGGIAKKYRSRRDLWGAVYVPREMINTRVVVVEATEYTKLLRCKAQLRRVQRAAEEPWEI